MRMTKERWVRLSLFNLCIVAALGFVLRTKILFPLPFIDFKNLLNAHSHFAFAGWVGLALSTCMIYELLPVSVHAKKIYQRILWVTMTTAVGMLITFPFLGYASASIIFSTAYIFTNYTFSFIFIRDARKHIPERCIRWLCYCSVVSLVLSSIGPFGLAYQMVSKSTGILGFRDFIYTFLHFQYNGFFTLGIVALFLNRLLKSKRELGKTARLFSIFMCCSILPTLMLSLLWHDQSILYWIAAIGCLLLVGSLYCLIRLLSEVRQETLFYNKAGNFLFRLSFLSLGFKLLLQIGTIAPALGNAVYGDRPLIIGFLHLVFLGFVTLYLLSSFIDEGYFTKKTSTTSIAFIVFVVGVFLNELLLMLQGLCILLQTTSRAFEWLLWITSVILFTGTILIYSAINRARFHKQPQSLQLFLPIKNVADKNQFLE